MRVCEYECESELRLKLRWHFPILGLLCGEIVVPLVVRFNFVVSSKGASKGVAQPISGRCFVV